MSDNLLKTRFLLPFDPTYIVLKWSFSPQTLSILDEKQ